MKKITFFLISILLISCSEMKDISAIKDAENITVCLLSAEVYNKESQDATKEYLEKREVLRTLDLKGEQRTLFLKEFLDEKNYEPLSRKCDFEPVYALLMNDKLFALLDVEYCPTMEFVNNKKSAKYIGITTENTLKKLLDENLK